MLVVCRRIGPSQGSTSNPTSSSRSLMSMGDVNAIVV